VFFLFGGVGGLIGIAIWMAIRKRAVVANWPFCAQCQSRRRALTLVGLLVAAVPLLAGLGTLIVLSGIDPTLVDHQMPAVIIIAMVGGLFGIVIMAKGRPTAMARAEITGDGAWVFFTQSHPAFAAAVAPTAQAAHAQASGYAAGPPTAHPQATGLAPDPARPSALGWRL
jgi:hypothetical protein